MLRARKGCVHDDERASTPSARAGRVDEIARTGAVLADAAAGRAQAVVLTGPAGVGKTWVLDRVLDRVAGGGDAPVVLRLAVHPAEQDLPYAGLHHLLGPLTHDIGSLPEPQRSAVLAALALAPLPPGDAFAVASGLHRLLTDLADDRGVVVAVDDVQWLDEPSRQALVFAARRLDADPVAVVLAARSPHLPDLRGTATTVVDLAPLDAGAARALVRAQHPTAALPAVEAVVAASGGLPIALTEIPAGLTDAQLRAEAPFPSPGPVGSTLARLFADRLDGLDDRSRSALLVASLEHLDREGLVAALGALDLDLDALDAPERRGLVRVGPDGAVFPHAAAAAAIGGLATDAMRRRAHRALAETLVGDPARRARHLAAVVTGPDPEVAAALADSASAAERRGAWLVAGQGHAAAADRETDPARARAHLRRAAVAHTRAGASAPLVRTLAALVDSAPGPDERLRTEAELVAARVWSGHPDLDVSGPRASAHRLGAVAPAEAARLLGAVAIGLIVSGRATEARADLDAARALAPASTDDDLALTYDLLEVYLSGVGGSVLLSDWVDTLTEEDLRVPSLWVMAATTTLVWADELDPADRLLRRQCDALRSIGALGQVGVSEALRAFVAQRHGDWATAAARYTGAIDLCTDTDLLGPLPHVLLRHAYLLAACGAERRCRDELDAAAALAPTSPVVDHLTDCVLGLSELSHGRADEAVAHLRRAGATEDRAGILPPGYSSRSADLVEALWRTRDLDAAREEADALTARSRRSGRPGPLAVAARSRALLAEAEAVDAAFGEAAELHLDVRDVFEEARTQLAWGRALRRTRRRRDARPRLRTALDAFEHLGAAPWAHQARSELAACGERRQAGRSATAELTPRELEVAVAVARGATNPEAAAELCISRRTVEDHLGRVYRKLGVHDRRALADALGATGAEGEDVSRPARPGRSS